MDSLVTFRASSGRGESLTLEVAIRGKLLSKLNSRNRFLISKYGRCTKNLQLRTFNFDQFPTFILRRPIRNSGEFVYVNLQRFRLDRCLASWKKKEEKKCKYFFIDVSRTFPRNILSFENDDTREKEKEKKETIISFKFN